METYDHDYDHDLMVRVNKCSPAILIRGVTVNGNTYFAYDICGREVCISHNRGETIEKMNKAVLDGVVF
jgi:hypothetical protein